MNLDVSKKATKKKSDYLAKKRYLLGVHVANTA
jgi:hypothetical protein